MRGDTADNVFSAYPGVRTKGTKTKVGLQEAFADRDSKGYSWNNMMLQRWGDHEGFEHRVIDDYQRNVIKVLRKLTEWQIHSINEFDHLKKAIDLLTLQLFDVKNKS